MTPLTSQRQAAHAIRNHLTFIAGTTHSLRRRLELGTVDWAAAGERLERVERAVWQIESLLDEAVGGQPSSTWPRVWGPQAAKEGEKVFRPQVVAPRGRPR